jgi:hypothetical protein
MELPCQGEATGFKDQREADTYGTFLLAQIRYQVAMEPLSSNEEYEACKEIVERLTREIRGEYEAILDASSQK